MSQKTLLPEKSEYVGVEAAAPREQLPAVVVNQEPAEALVAFSEIGVGIDVARGIATQLHDIVQKQKLWVKIGPKNHLIVEAWCTCAAMCGLSPRTVWSKRITDADGAVIGYESRVEVVRISTNEVVGAAEAECWLDEKQGSRPRWGDKFAAKGMSQTRATSRAIAQILRWIPVLAGYSGTPAEEVGDDGPPVDNPTQRGPRAQPRGKRATAAELTGLIDTYKAWRPPEDRTKEKFAVWAVSILHRSFENAFTPEEWSPEEIKTCCKALEEGR